MRKLILLGRLINNPALVKLGRKFLQTRSEGIGAESTKTIIAMDEIVSDYLLGGSEMLKVKGSILSWIETYIDLESMQLTAEDVLFDAIQIYKERNADIIEKRYGVSISDEIPSFLPMFLEQEAFPFAKELFILAAKETGNEEIYKEYLSKDMYSILGVKNLFEAIDAGNDFFLNFFKNIFHEFQHNAVNPKAHEIFLDNGSVDNGLNYNLLDIIDEAFAIAAGAYADPAGSSYEKLETNLLKTLSYDLLINIDKYIGSSFDVKDSILNRSGNLQYIKVYLDHYKDIISNIDKVSNIYIDTDKKKKFLKDILKEFKIRLEYIRETGEAFDKYNVFYLIIKDNWNENMIDFVTSNYEDLLIEYNNLLDKNINHLYSKLNSELLKYKRNFIDNIIKIIKNDYF